MSRRRYSFKWLKRGRPKGYVKSLFASWDKTLRRYEQSWSHTGDLPYVYNQQAQVGLLAIASERIPALPFIEFSTEKRKERKNYSGRADLSIMLKNTKEEISIEAERTVVHYDAESGEMVARLRKPMKKAWEELFQTLAGNDSGTLGLAILFVIVDKASESTFDEDSFLNEIYSASKKLGVDFCAAHFCSPEIWAKTEYQCPGIVCIGKSTTKW